MYVDMQIGHKGSTKGERGHRGRQFGAGWRISQLVLRAHNCKSCR